ncbi:MAG: hypothetical protein WCT53_05415 [Candidatus Gracilibacteria bacterium]|jgi:hypothetical protein
MDLLFFQHKSINLKFVFKGGETPGGAEKHEEPRLPHQPLFPAEHAQKMEEGWDWVRRGDKANDPLQISPETVIGAKATQQAQSMTEKVIPKLEAAGEWAKYGDKGAPPPEGHTYAEDWTKEKAETSSAVATNKEEPKSVKKASKAPKKKPKA